MPPRRARGPPSRKNTTLTIRNSVALKMVRIPVRWDNHTGTTPPYQIDLEIKISGGDAACAEGKVVATYTP